MITGAEQDVSITTRFERVTFEHNRNMNKDDPYDPDPTHEAAWSAESNFGGSQKQRTAEAPHAAGLAAVAHSHVRSPVHRLCCAARCPSASPASLAARPPSTPPLR